MDTFIGDSDMTKNQRRALSLLDELEQAAKLTEQARQIQYGTKSLSFITEELRYLIKYYMSDTPSQ